MTRLFVDQKEIPSLPPGIDSLDQLLRHVEQTQLGPKCVVRQVSVDGLPVLADQLEGNASNACGNISSRETIEIITGSVGEIVVESIEEAIAYAERLQNVIPSIAASLQSSPGRAVFENLRQLYEGFYWLNLLLDRLNSLVDISPEKRQANVTPFSEHQERFLFNLRQMVRAHEQEDFVLLADLLEYEIVPLIPDLKKLFADMAKRVERAQ